MELFKIIGKELFGDNPVGWGLFVLAGLVIYIRIKFVLEVKYLKKKIEEMKEQIKEKQEQQQKEIIGFMHEVNDGFRACNDFSLHGLENIRDRLLKLTEDLYKLIGKDEVKGK
jgi:hypothetical protein